MAMPILDKQTLSKLLTDTIPMLCKNSLPAEANFRIEAMIGITLMDNQRDDNVVLVCFQQTVSEGECTEQSYGDNSKSLPPPPPPALVQCKREVSVVNHPSSSISVKSEPGTDEHFAAGANEPISIEDDEEGEGQEEYYDEDGQYGDTGDGGGEYDGQEEDESAYYDDGTMGDPEYAGGVKMEGDDGSSAQYYDPSQPSTSSWGQQPQFPRKRNSMGGVAKSLVQRSRQRQVTKMPRKRSVMPATASATVTNSPAGIGQLVCINVLVHGCTVLLLTAHR